MLQLLAPITGETCEQGRRSDQVSTVPFFPAAALFDNVDVVANLQREVELLGGGEGSGGNGESDCMYLISIRTFHSPSARAGGAQQCRVAIAVVRERDTPEGRGLHGIAPK